MKIENIFKDILEVTRKAIEEDSADEIIFGLLDLCEKAAALPERKRKRMWVKRVEGWETASRFFCIPNQGTLPMDPGSFKNYLRLAKSQFEFLLNLVKPQTGRCSSLRRKSISAAEKLAATLRSLASGESFVSLNYQQQGKNIKRTENNQ